MNMEHLLAATNKVVELNNQLTAVTEQRDGLHELHNNNAARSKELLELCGTLREQRDRLVDLVKQFIYILDITEESDGGRSFHPTNITSCRAGDLQKIGELVEALRRASRNQPAP
jgi:protein tyrosine phosphatase